ncbi:MAG: hypothetical protein H5U36_10010 [Candidatus Caldatribacterium sp.]|nr:hypothetical protein [Candidatus Caldatribacterium sp.]
MSRKPLGRGLEVFFSRDSERAIFQKALEHDRKGEVFEAFHLYMKVAEQRGTLRTKALNNAAVILAEHGFIKQAAELLREVLQEDADNAEARENLVILEGDAK